LPDMPKCSTKEGQAPTILSYNFRLRLTGEQPTLHRTDSTRKRCAKPRGCCHQHNPVHFMTTMLAAVLVSWTAQWFAVVGAGSV
jgi:hypothetical protein